MSRRRTTKSIGVEKRIDVPASVPYLLRPHRPGDIGWIIHRQAVLYAREYHWNEEYEALVARIRSARRNTLIESRSYS